jgi:hypothetical protein
MAAVAHLVSADTIGREANLELDDDVSIFKYLSKTRIISLNQLKQC